MEEVIFPIILIMIQEEHLMNRTNPPLSKAGLTQKYRTSRMNLLAVIVFTLLNVVFLMSGSDMYFLFTAAIPYHLVVVGMLLTGKFPPEMYEGGTFEFLDSSFLVATVVIAAVILTLLPEVLRGLNDYRMLMYAIVLILMMLFTSAPSLIALRQQIMARFSKKSDEGKETT